MKALRIKLHQPIANYRPHYSMQVRHSYPLPPPSAVIGLIHKVLGMKPGDNYKNWGETIKGVDVAILGKYGGIGWDYQWLLSSQKKGIKIYSLLHLFLRLKMLNSNRYQQRFSF
ncbi:MAG: CRISPR-associated protein Cas5 [Candidatus Aenigmatarchaeota archaeon]